MLFKADLEETTVHVLILTEPAPLSVRLAEVP